MFERTFSFWRSIVGTTAGSAASLPVSSPNEDRRLWLRYATDLPSNVQLAENNNKISAKIRDLSLGGANLQVDEPMQTGQMVSIELPGDANEIQTVLACVVRVSTDSDGKYSLGCVFSRELSGDRAGDAGAGKTEANPDDKRTWMRHTSVLRANYRKVGDPIDVSHPAEVLNISANGIGLAVAPSLAAGSLLNVDLHDKDGRMVRTILACVVHTTQRSGGDYALGCNFIRELNEEELKTLL